MVGTTIGNYRLEAAIAKGGMGTIYRARRLDDGRVVAVKVLRRELAANRTFLLRFQREVRALRGVEHPNVVRILDVGSQGQLQFYVMEYFEKSLADLLREGPLEPVRALRVAAQAARGLQAVHDAGVIHRDVKPSNILIGEDGVARIGDFGVARLATATRMTHTGAIIGTPAYMAPEQAENPEVGARADIYSLGVVLYEMLTGRPPFEGNTALDILQKHRLNLPEPPKSLNPRLPGALSRLVLAMLAKDPTKRPASMDVVADALEHLAGNLEGHSADEEPQPRELSSTELRERYERTYARVVFWAKRAAALAALVLVAFVVYRVGVYLNRGPADYMAEAAALEADDEPGKALKVYEALLERFPQCPEAERARQRAKAIRQEQRRRALETASLALGGLDAVGKVRAEIAAQHFRRAEALEANGYSDDARRIYLLLRDRFADTPWGLRAAQRLKAMPARPEPDTGEMENAPPRAPKENDAQ